MLVLFAAAAFSHAAPFSRWLPSKAIRKPRPSAGSMIPKPEFSEYTQAAGPFSWRTSFYPPKRKTMSSNPLPQKKKRKRTASSRSQKKNRPRPSPSPSVAPGRPRSPPVAPGRSQAGPARSRGCGSGPSAPPPPGSPSPAAPRTKPTHG